MAAIQSHSWRLPRVLLECSCKGGWSFKRAVQPAEGGTLQRNPRSDGAVYRSLSTAGMAAVHATQHDGEVVDPGVRSSLAHLAHQGAVPGEEGLQRVEGEGQDRLPRRDDDR